MWFPSTQIRRDGGFTLDGGVFPLSGIKAEVFLLLFNRRLGLFRDEKIVKSYKIFYNRPGAHEQACLSRMFPFMIKILLHKEDL